MEGCVGLTRGEGKRHGMPFSVHLVEARQSNERLELTTRCIGFEPSIGKIIIVVLAMLVLQGIHHYWTYV